MADKLNMVMKNYDVGSESSENEEEDMNTPFGGFPPIALCRGSRNAKDKNFTRTFNPEKNIAVPLSKILSLRKNINRQNRQNRQNN